MDNTQKPSPGRIVHVHIGDRPDGEGGTTPILRPAMVTSVWTNDCVNATVFLENGDDVHPFGTAYGEKRTSLLFGEALGQWRWPSKV